MPSTCLFTCHNTHKSHSPGLLQTWMPEPAEAALVMWHAGLVSSYPICLWHACLLASHTRLPLPPPLLLALDILLLGCVQHVCLTAMHAKSRQLKP